MKRQAALIIIPVALVAAFVTVQVLGKKPGSPANAGLPQVISPPPSAEGSARQTLESWTYPGVHTTTMSGAMGFYSASRGLSVKASPDQIWQFYSHKTGYTLKTPHFPLGMASESVGPTGSGTIYVEQAQPGYQKAYFYLTTPQSVTSAIVTVFKAKGTCSIFLHVGTPAPAAAPSLPKVGSSPNTTRI